MQSTCNLLQIGCAPSSKNTCAFFQASPKVLDTFLSSPFILNSLAAIKNNVKSEARPIARVARLQSETESNTLSEWYDPKLAAVNQRYQSRRRLYPTAYPHKLNRHFPTVLRQFCHVWGCIGKAEAYSRSPATTSQLLHHRLAAMLLLHSQTHLHLLPPPAAPLPTGANNLSPLPLPRPLGLHFGTCCIRPGELRYKLRALA